MGLIDIIIIALILLSAIIGTVKGFVKSLLGFFGWIIAIVLAVSLASPTGTLLSDKTSIDDSISTKLESTVTGWSSYMSTELTQENYHEVITSALGETKIPEFVQQPIVQAIDGLVESNADTVIGKTPAVIISSTLANLAVTAIAFIIIFILTLIIIAIIKHFLTKAISKVNLIKKIDKVLGFLFGLVEGFVIVCLIIGVLGFITSMGMVPQLSEMLNEGIITPKLSEFVQSILSQYLQISVGGEG